MIAIFPVDIVVHSIGLENELAANGDFENCCKKGAMGPFEQREPPQVLRELYSNAHALNNEFIKNIRLYNAALS